MSEEQSDYINQKYNVLDEAVQQDYFARIPNIVDDMKLSVFSFRLYCHLRRVAGDEGMCWQSTDTLAKTCCMSAGSISTAKAELTEKGLIKLSTKSGGAGGYHHEITITDIWKKNHEHGVNSKKVSPHELEVSPHELEVSPGETKKNPIKKNPNIDSTTTTQNTFSYYESNIGALTPFIADAIQQDIDDYSETWVIEAIREAVKSEARNMKYIEAILKRWKRDGFKAQKKTSGPKYVNKKDADFFSKLAALRDPEEVINGNQK